MWEMAKSSIALFFQGRLFKDKAQVFRQILTGTLFTAIVMLVIAAGLSAFGMGRELIWISSAIAGFLGGALQPYLFKDLKYM
jgi:hypothetical protein